MPPRRSGRRGRRGQDPVQEVRLPPLRSLKGVAEEIIADLPQVGREAWHRVISNRADAEYSEAVRTANWATISRIASQDVHTPAGYAAVDLLGNRHLDQNRPLAAIRQFYRLLKSEAATPSFSTGTTAVVEQ